MTNKNINYDDYVIDRFKKDEKFLRSCVESAFEAYEKDGEISYLLDTLRQAVSVKGFSNLSNETGISRQYLYDIFSKKGNPTLKVFDQILQVLGYKMSFKAI